MTDAGSLDVDRGDVEPGSSAPAGRERKAAPLGARNRSSTAMDELTRFLARTWNELEVRLDPNTRTLWCWMRPSGPPSFTPGMLRELIQLHRAMQSLVLAQSADEEPLIKYYVQGSHIPGIFNLGGDLGYISEAVRAGNRDKVRRYAHDCVDPVFNAGVDFDCGVVSVALVQGDALGGGFEAALCCNVLIAERSARFGLPEVLFNSFPGMGAYSFLARRLDAARAERMILSGRIHTADEMADLGLVHQVVEDGEGEAAVAAFLADRRNHSMRSALSKVRRRVNPITLGELRDVTDIWVDSAMRLGPADLRRMEHLQLAQIRRLNKTGGRRR